MKSHLNYYKPLSKQPITQQEKAPSQLATPKITARKAFQQPSVYQFDRFKSYQDASSPKLTQHKRQAIEQKLQLQRIAETNTSQRLKIGKLFVTYSHNPFLQNDLALKKRYFKEQDQSIAKEDDHIVTAINELKQHNIAAIARPQHKDRRLQYAKISQNNQQIGTNIRKQVAVAQIHRNIQHKQLSFEQIVEIKEDIYRPIKNLNIFQIKNLTKEDVGLESVLAKHYLHLDLYSIHTSKYRIPFETHISSVSRKAVFSHRRATKQQQESNELGSNQSSVYLESISFENLMSVSSGRLTPRTLYNSVFNTSKQQNPQRQSQIQEVQIEYAPNTANSGCNFQAGHFQREEVEKYLRLELSQQEKQSFRKYTDISKVIRQQISMRNQIVNTRINDKRLHNNIQSSINDNLSYLYSLDQRTLQNVDRLIAKNKISKDRKTTFKNSVTINTLQMKKQQQRKIKQLVPNDLLK